MCSPTIVCLRAVRPVDPLLLPNLAEVAPNLAVSRKENASSNGTIEAGAGFRISFRCGRSHIRKVQHVLPQREFINICIQLHD